MRDVVPQIFEPVELARLGCEDVENDVQVVADDPRRLGDALDERGSRPCSCFSRSCTSSQIAFTWRGLFPVHTTKKSVYAQTGRISRMTTSRASLSCASAAIRRAWSIGLKLGQCSPRERA